MLPITGLCAATVMLAVLDPNLRLAALVPLVVTLPLLLQSAESRWRRVKGRAIEVDRRGMRIGELSVRWTDVAEIQVGPLRAERRGGHVIKIRIDRSPGRTPRRSLILAVGLHPGDGYFDFCLGPDYTVPIDEMARVIGTFAGSPAQ